MVVKRGNYIRPDIVEKAIIKEKEYNKKIKNGNIFDLCIKHDICPNCGEKLRCKSKPKLVVHGVTELIEYTFECICGFKYIK